MFHKTIISIFVLYLFTALTPAYAQHDGVEGHDQDANPIINHPADASDIAVSPSEAVIIVHGIVCSFCTQGVIRNLSKLAFIDKSRYSKGVKVEIEIQKVTIAIKPDSEIDLEQVFASILKGGYEPVEAYVSNRDGTVSIHKPDEA